MSVDSASLLTLVWQELAAAVSLPEHPWRIPVLVTGGSQPDGRVVVLRRFQRAPDRLTFFTDARSPKLRAIREDPRVAWVFYHPVLRLQVRVRGQATLQPGTPAVRAHWEALSEIHRREYAAATAPGSPWSGAGFLEWAEAAAHFAVVETEAEEWDCLQLDRNEHSRFRFHGGLMERLVP